jgi:fatty acid-binding protein 3
LTSSENYGEYLKAIGVSFLTRKSEGSAKPNVVISTSGDTWTIQTVTSFKTSTVSFSLGVPVDEETRDGRKVTATFTLDGSTLTEVQKDATLGAITIVRDFSNPSQMVETLKAGDVVATRTFTKQ